MIAMRVAMRSTDMVSSFAYSDTWGGDQVARRRRGGLQIGPGWGQVAENRAPLQGCGV